MPGLSNGMDCDEMLPDTTILIAGGGPVGLLLATILAHHGTKSVICERNTTTTKWPKMDLTNSRSMEMLRRLGLADGLRDLGVPSHIPQPILFSSGLSRAQPFSRWDLPSVDEYRATIKRQNDGSMPREPWQRLSQAVLEVWLRGLCDENPLIDLRFGTSIDNVEETEAGVVVSTRDVNSGATKTLQAHYLAGCDGANSKTRRNLGLPLDGGPMPVCVLLIHFKSPDLARLHKQGHFWHIFFVREPGIFSGAIIAQDEVETWTTHLFLPLDADPSTLSSEDAVAMVLGGLHEPYPIQIDEVLVRSVWRPNIAVARQWTSTGGHVFLAGDAAHQNIPTGGYGLNMGIGDAYDLGWKLAAVSRGYAHPGLLKSYEPKRRPVALRNTERSGQHMKVHEEISKVLENGGTKLLDADDRAGQTLRQQLHEYYQQHDSENKDMGVEMGYRYQSSCILPPEESESEPPFSPSHYIPTTWPGGRAPHVFLNDGSSIFDQLGKDWTLVTFTDATSNGSAYVELAAKTLNIPMKHLHLEGEDLAHALWERDVVLVRPDEHIAWRTNCVLSLDAALDRLATVIGMMTVVGEKGLVPVSSDLPLAAFTSTDGMATQTTEYELERMGDFQR